MHYMLFILEDIKNQQFVVRSSEAVREVKISIIIIMTCQVKLPLFV